MASVTKMDFYAATRWTLPGDADSSAGLTAFIQYLADHGAVGIIPAGRYTIKSKVIITSAANPFYLEFAPGAWIDADLQAADNVLEFRSLSNVTLVAPKINGRHPINSNTKHGLVLRDCNNVRVLGTTEIEDWGSTGILVYSSTGTHDRVIFDRARLYSSDNLAGNGFLIEDMTNSGCDYVWVKGVSGVGEGPGYAVQLKNSCVGCYYGGYTAIQCQTAIACGRDNGGQGVLNSTFGAGVAIQCQEFYNGSNADNIVVAPAVYDATGRTETTAAIVISGGSSNNNFAGVSIANYNPAHDAPIYINSGSNNNTVRLAVVDGAATYSLVGGNQNRIVVDIDTSVSSTPDISTKFLEEGTAANNNYECHAIGHQWASANNPAFQVRGFQFRPATDNTCDLGAPTAMFRRSHLARIEFKVLSTPPSGGLTAGTVAMSDGTSGSASWGASGAGLYRWNGSAWVFVG